MPAVNSRVTASGETRWYVRFRADGIQTSLTFPTERKARIFANDCDTCGAQAAFDAHMATAALEHEQTVDEWADRFFGLLPHVSPATMEGYRRDWTHRWSPHLGPLKLSQVTTEDIIRALATQQGADKTIENAWGVLAMVFKGAVFHKQLDTTPTAGVRLPRRTGHLKQPHRYLTWDEFKTMLDAPFGDHWKPLMWFLAGTGARWGEATALTVADIRGEYAHITKAWKRNPETGPYVGQPKTAKSIRTIALPWQVAEQLEPLRVGRRGTELLFTDPHGNHIRHHHFYRTVWPRFTALIDPPAPRIHDLRHTHVAWLIAENTGLPVIQARLGHEKITTTIDTYGHLLPDIQLAAARAAENIMGNPQPKQLHG